MFLVYTFFDFIVFIGCYLIILSHGAVANEIDYNFKEIIIQLWNDAMLVKKLA